MPQVYAILDLSRPGFIQKLNMKYVIYFMVVGANCRRAPLVA